MSAAAINTLYGEIARLRASLAAIHSRLTSGKQIDSHTISSVIAECEHAVQQIGDKKVTKPPES